MTEEQPESLTDAELDALDAEITRDMALNRAMNDAVIGKVRRFRAALAQRQSATREPEPGDFRPRPSGEPWPERGPHVHGNGDPDPSSL